MATQLAPPAGSGTRSDLLNALSELASSQMGIVERKQLIALGFTPARIHSLVESAVLIRLHRGVYAVGHTAISRPAQLLAATYAVGGVSAISKRTAADHMGLFSFSSGDIDVTLAGKGGRSLNGINVHRSRSFGPGHLTEYEGVPVATAAWVLAELAGSIGPASLRRCFDVADRRDLLDHSELAYLIRRGAGRRGNGQLRQLAGLDRTQPRRTRSVLELDFLAFCREEGIPEPLVNHTIGGFEVDACWPDSSLVVELDSWEWHGDREAFERDRAKVLDLEAQGWRVVAVTDRRLKRERSQLAEKITKLLAQGDATLVGIPKAIRVTFG